MDMFNELAVMLSRAVELSILGKATVLLAIGLGAAFAARRAAASIRHLFLTATFAALALLPVLMLTVPGVSIELPAKPTRAVAIAPRAAGPVFAVSTIPNPVRSNSIPWSTALRLTWIAGFAALSVGLGVNLWRLRRVRRHGIPWLELRDSFRLLALECGVSRRVDILLHEDIPGPLTCGLLHPAIILPADARAWSERDLRSALVHELEHIRRADWATQTGARVVCALYWFHPLAWVAWRRLGLEAERACDDAVLRRADAPDYADQLVTFAQRLSTARVPLMLGMAKRSDLATRVSAILDRTQRRERPSWATAGAAIVIAGAVVVAIAPVRAIAQSPRISAIGTQVQGLDRALYKAARRGDVVEMTSLLDAGANANTVLSGDGTPLIAAARNGHTVAIRLLLDRGADPNLPVPGDGNPLIMAAREGHTDAVQMLLDRGASIDQIVPDDENALIQASSEGHLNVVTMLVNRGANVNARTFTEAGPGRPNGEWRSPLSMARKHGRTAVVAFLQSAGARE